MPLAQRFLIAFALAALIGGLAYWRKSLSLSGAFGATVLGTLTFGFGGLAGSAVLLAFFISSSALSKFKAKRKHAVAEKFSKGSTRDFWQTMANGGMAAIAITAWGLTDNPIYWVAFAAAYATANADTWATELGTLATQTPRLITNLSQTVTTGTSGGVTVWGTTASFLGALLIGLVAQLLGSFNILSVLAIAIGGLVGALSDSWLGATVQATYFCETCQLETEQHPVHSCGTPTTQTSGAAWMNNDWVNFLATFVGAIVGGGLSVLL